MYSRDFVAEAVVPALLSRGNGLIQLEDGQKRFSEFRDQANLELRKNAFTYHNAILKASKDMQVLEKNLLEFKNTLAEEKRALNTIMNVGDGGGNRREKRKSTYFNGSLDTVVGRYKADDEKPSSDNSNIQEIPRWFLEAATDIEDHYEMRRYKDAVDLLVAAKKYYDGLVWKDPEQIRQTELHYRLILDVEQGLIDHLLEALKAAMVCPFGVDAACCRRLIEHPAISGQNIRCLCGVFGQPNATASADYLVHDCGFLGTVRDFAEFGFDGIACRSALIGWIRFHVDTFVGMFADEIFAPKNSLAAAAESVTILRKNAGLLADVGVDEVPMVDAALENDSIRFVDHHVGLFVQSSQRIFQDGKVQPILFKSKEIAALYLETIAKAGLGMSAAYMDGLRLNVSEQYLQFGKVALRLIEDIVTVSSPSMARNVKTWMYAIIAPYINALQTASARASDTDVNIAALSGTAEFGVKNLLPRAEESVKEKFIQTNYLFSVQKDALSRVHTSAKVKVTAPTFV
ncbi:hypothetical protein BV898_14463 [Hypsibius exemplaris]|uniref:Uncharacterized protein n=1 Tax=Hypsibius exemplaris TaxID=2072580 RepID=A0A9X6NIA9_HYPEX|nr:hypothetical protein BV898_14463 [Hypsibius exemplaris]